jgi:type II secretory pathway pseudopilin PulG
LLYLIQQRNFKGCTYKQNQIGFTLVEIAIVMIVIGLLIGGTFSGLKLVEASGVNKTIQDIKQIESSALQFKDTYGRIPGDIANPASRLPNCTSGPCSTSGNGNRRLDTVAYTEAFGLASEKATFWFHLQASGIGSFETKDQIDLSSAAKYGVPITPIGNHYRLSELNTRFLATGSYVFQGAVIFITAEQNRVAMSGSSLSTLNNSCSQIAAIDRKIDDVFPYNGKIQGWGCASATAVNSPDLPSREGALLYDLGGF